jgi:hypothetical protein
MSESTFWDMHKFIILTGSRCTYYAPTLILRIILYCVSEHAIVGWINIIKDKESLTKLISNAFCRLAFMSECYMDYLSNNKPSDFTEILLDSATRGKGLSLLMSMYAFRKMSLKMGLEKQTDEILDLLWEFNKDILKFLFPEIELYKWEFNYELDNWRRLFEIYENNPSQTLYNYHMDTERQLNK